eukprot:gene7289-8103_t
MNIGKRFATLLFTRKLQQQNRDQNEVPSAMELESGRMPGPKDVEFINVLRIWFTHLVNNGYVNEMLSCMETSLDVYNELKTDILKCTGSILLANGLCFAAYKLYKFALNDSHRSLALLEGFEQACNNCIPRWHFKMLNDFERNSAYKKAISKAVAEGHTTVLDIGSGTGILSLFAAESGARSIFACECSDVMLDISKNVIAETKYKNHIKIINKMSTDLEIGNDVNERVSLVITEVFDCGLFGEGVISILKHAWKTLLKAQGSCERLQPKMIPSGARLYACLIESEELRMHSKSKMSAAGLTLENVCLIGRQDPGDNSEQPYTAESLGRLKTRYNRLSDSIQIMEINFNDPSELEGLEERTFFADLPIITEGYADAIAVWFELQLDEDTQVSTSPEHESCWQQAIYHLETENKRGLLNAFVTKMTSEFTSFVTSKLVYCWKQLLVAMPSTCIVAESEKKFDIVVMEIVDENGLLALRLFDDIILIRHGVLIPERFTIDGSFIYSAKLDQESFVTAITNTMGFEIGKFINEFQVCTHPDIDLRTLPLTKMTEDFQLFDISLMRGNTREDLDTSSPERNEHKVLRVTNNGYPSALAYWFNICLQEDCVINTATVEPMCHWHQAAVILKDQQTIERGNSLFVDLSLNQSYVYINGIGLK